MIIYCGGLQTLQGSNPIFLNENQFNFRVVTDEASELKIAVHSSSLSYLITV